jgi:hypothetical protein
MNTHSRLNRIYIAMKQRCYNPKYDHYKFYGERGIKICDEWLNPEIIHLGCRGRITKGYFEFKKWAINNGYSDNLTIDRIDVNGNYEPSNCRWITIKEQCNNTRRNRLFTYKGKTQTLTQWSEELGFNYGRVKMRLYKLHWTVEKAFEFNN